MKFSIILVILTFICSFTAKSQTTESKKKIDVIYYKSVPLVIYDDYSWDYLHQSDKQGIFNLNNIKYLDTFSVFKQNWINNTIAPYPRKRKIPDTVKIVISDTFVQKEPFLTYRELMSGFGRRGRIFHPGLDIKLKTGKPIYTLFSGKVRYARWNKGGYGNFVMIRHFNGLETCYAHLSKIAVKENQLVKQGTIIGYAGSTGRAYGVHLHLEMRYKGFAFDPETVIDFKNARVKADTIILTSKSFGYKTKANNYQTNATNYKAKTFYKIKSGDTLSHIAVKYNTTVSSLCKINGLSRNSILRIGQVLKIR